jgi:hypothetical protein
VEVRIGEALAVHKSCFRDGGKTLRIFEQVTPDGKGTAPLKYRKAGERAASVLDAGTAEDQGTGLLGLAGDA